MYTELQSIKNDSFSKILENDVSKDTGL